MREILQKTGKVMTALLHLPPPLTLVIVLAVAAYVIYHIVSTGTVQPLTVIPLILLGFGLVRYAS